MKYELKKVLRDGKEIWKLKCPKCEDWGALDNDQFYGRVSTWCDCGFHEIIDFSKYIRKD